jgi:subtilisin family serine protease
MSQRRSRSLIAAGVLLALAALTAPVPGPVAAQVGQGVAADQAPVHPASQRPIPGQYIVVLKSDADPRAAAAVAGVSPKYVYTAALNGFAATLNQGQLTALQHNRQVAYIEQDAEVQADDATTQSGATWGLDRVDQRALPLSATYTYTSTGASVTAYIIDTGIRFAHSEFGRRATSGTDTVDGGTPDDCNGHGTHVAGTVGGSTYGVAKNVNLVAVRVLNCSGSGSRSGVIAGLDWVTNTHASTTPAVANMSLGGGANTSVDTALKNMIADKVATAVAAGNGNFLGIAQDACKSSPPACRRR